MSILAYVAKINAFLSKYIHEQKSTDFFFFLSLQIHLLLHFTKDKGSIIS